MKEKNVLKTVGIIFAIVGLILLIGGLAFVPNAFDNKNKVETKAIISDITSKRNSDGDIDYDTYVVYEVDGREYESKLNSYVSSYYIGKEITIYYDEKNPTKIGTKGADYLMLMVPGMGVLFFVIGAGITCSQISGKNKDKRLKETGELITVTYVETKLNTAFSVNGQNPYIIICEWVNPEDGQTYTFKSKNIWMNPEDEIKAKNITSFPVYINMKNKKKYVVDIDMLKEEGIE